MRNNCKVTGLTIYPEKTAIYRKTCSRPTQLALAHNIITNATTVLDYGCGLGADVRYLKALRIDCLGFDPFYCPQPKPRKSDVVLLNYVLNIIPDEHVRTHTLKKAISLAKKTLIIAVRLEKPPPSYTKYQDGYLTKRSTFQKFYTQKEFLTYLKTLTPSPICSLGKGVVYINQTNCQKIEPEIQHCV